MFSGSARNQFEKHLDNSWRYLANELEIPTWERRTWQKGLEGNGIWAWLEARTLLNKLPDALRRINRVDLAELLVHRAKPQGRILLERLAPPQRHFVGRDDELRQLDAAWESDTTNIVELVAFGGVGKSALIAQWLKRLAVNDWRGAKQVFGYGFANRGGDNIASTDEFLETALTFLGDEQPTQGYAPEKARRLVNLARAKRLLLILDGVEPYLQPSPGESNPIQDLGLRTVIRSLATANQGLCVISTRVAIQDIEGWEDTTVHRIDLEHLSDVAGASLLNLLGVSGSEEQRQHVSRQVKGHALTLTLLGSYLKLAFGGDIGRIDEIELYRADDELQSHAAHMMKRYEQFLGEGSELSIMRLLGLFNRPATPDELRALRAEPAISGITESIVALNEAKWNIACSTLSNCRLLSRSQADQSLDTHPLVRDYFANQIAACPDESLKEAHRRLYEHLKSAAPEQPINLKEMMPLYDAVDHACRAGLELKAMQEVYAPRILQGEQQYSWKFLGAAEQDLMALRSFFDGAWTRPSNRLPPVAQADVLGLVGLCLKAIGDMPAAIEVCQFSLELAVSHQHWIIASNTAFNLSEICLCAGKVGDAVRYGEQCVAYAARTQNHFKQLSSRPCLAAALHASGMSGQANHAFLDAESMAKEMGPDFQVLFSTAGFKFCQLLLDEQGVGASETRDLDSPIEGIRRVRARAEQTIRHKSEGWYSAIDVALDELTLGRTFLLETVLNDDPDERRSMLEEARQILDDSVGLLRTAGTQDWLVLALIQRAASWRTHLTVQQENGWIKEFQDKAEQDLSEAESIAERGSMLAWRIDTALERARLQFALGAHAETYEGEGQETTKREHLMVARERIAEVKRLVKKSEQRFDGGLDSASDFHPPDYLCVFLAGDTVGYHCRDREIKQLQEQIDAAG